MRVLFLQRQPCIRAMKYAVALQSADPDIEIAFAYQGRTLSAFYGSGDELFTGWWDLGLEPRPEKALRRVLRLVRPDIVHSHNLPDALTILAQDLCAGVIPVIHDIHDLQSLRRTPYRDGFDAPPDLPHLERLAVERSDGVITVSPELVDVIEERYDIPGDVLVIPNLALRRDLPHLPERAPGRPPVIVYQGSLSADGGHYDLRDMFTAVAEAGATLHVHPNRHVPEYAGLAPSGGRLVVHEPLTPAALMARLPEYDVGWTGFNATLNGAHLDTVLPNKLFEFLGAGLPVVTLRSHRALARFVEEERVGILVDHPAEAAEAVLSADLAVMRRRIVASRDRFTFEGNASAVLELYRSLTSSPVAARHG